MTHIQHTQARRTIAWIKRLASGMAAALLAMPWWARAAGLITCGNDPNNVCTYNDFKTTLDRVVQFSILYIAIPAAAIVMIIGGIFMIFDGGSESRFKQGKKMIQGVVIGLLITLGAWIIVKTILNLLFA